MPETLQSKLDAVIVDSFVGRVDLLDRFSTFLSGTATEDLFQYIHGPGGIGKTTLLKHYAALSRKTEIQSIYLDGRTVESTPVAFREALSTELNVGHDDDPVEFIMSTDQKFLLQLDTYESILSLEPWLLRKFFPTLPGTVSVVIAGRNPPSPGWDTLPGYRSMFDSIELTRLNADESRDYLRRKGIAGEQHDTIVAFTKGHPLALSLVAEVARLQPDNKFSPSQDPDIIKALLNRFLVDVPSPSHRMAIEASALVRFTTVPLLSLMLDLDDASEIFDWLRGLSFMETGRNGIYPHDLAREVFSADLKWRNIDQYEQLHNASRSYYKKLFEETDDERQKQVLSDYVYLHRDNPIIQPFYETLAQRYDQDVIVTDTFDSEDRDTILDIVEKHEGSLSREHIEFWIDRQPENVLVLRNAEDIIIGFLLSLALHRSDEQYFSRDPATASAWSYLEKNAALRENERATIFRSWMSTEDYQDLSMVQTHLFLHMVRHYLTTPNLAFSFLPFSFPDFWEMICAYADLDRLPEADFTVDGHPFGVFGHDWRKRPATDWLDLLANRELGMATEPAPVENVSEPLAVLSRDEFASGVKMALKNFAKPWKLKDNPLLNSKSINESLAETDEDEARIDALRSLIERNVEALKNARKGGKYYRAIFRTYLKPAGSQEAAAELLDLPYSTFRRHLKQGVDELIDMMWHSEVK